MTTIKPPAEDEIVLNGISYKTGQYLVSPIQIPQCSALITNTDVTNTSTLIEPVLGLPPGVDPGDIATAGWGIVFGSSEDIQVREALAPLIEHRRKQVGNDQLIKVLEYRPGETRARWLGRNDVAAGAPDPYKIPYYLLIVGSPTTIPFTFTSLLDIEYAIGRLYFDTAEEYKRYAESVIEYETRQTPVPSKKEILFFATEHPADKATTLSSQSLVQPLAEGLAQLLLELPPGAPGRSFTSRCLCGEAATKHALQDTLESAGRNQSAIFFVATHGVGVEAPGGLEQEQIQGALLCQDWRGLGDISSAVYFAEADIPQAAQLNGVIAFLFACYSVATPQYDRYFHKKGKVPREIAKAPFFAKLPQGLLSHSGGGALACVGHIDRAWGWSIAPAEAGVQLRPFQNFFSSLLRGQPIGQAVQDFNHRYSVLSADLAQMLEMVDFGVQIPGQDLARLWIEKNDAEGYVVFGDPAVSLRIEDFA